MTYVAVAGLFIVYLITEYPAPACAAGALALWLLCRAAGSLVPAAAFALYCALTALVYAAGRAFFHTTTRSSFLHKKSGTVSGSA